MEKPEGYTVEGYFLDDSLYYASEYIKKINDTQGVVVWEEELDEDKREGVLLQTNGKRCMVKVCNLSFVKFLHINCLQ